MSHSVEVMTLAQIGQTAPWKLELMHPQDCGMLIWTTRNTTTSNIVTEATMMARERIEFLKTLPVEDMAAQCLDENEPEVIAPIYRRECDIEKQPLLSEQTRGFVCLLYALFGEINVGPAGEKIFQIPVTLTVAKKHQLDRHRDPPAGKDLQE